MKHARLGRLDVARIGFGAMGMSAYYTGAREDDEQSIRTIHRAIDLGVTLIDTAEVYGPYLDEELVGRRWPAAATRWCSRRSSASSALAARRTRSTSTWQTSRRSATWTVRPRTSAWPSRARCGASGRRGGRAGCRRDWRHSRLDRAGLAARAGRRHRADPRNTPERTGRGERRCRRDRTERGPAQPAE